MTARRPWTVRGEYVRDPRGYIERRSIPEPMSGCWLWLRSVGTHGYGLVGSPGVTAHRASFLAFNGDVPDGLVVRHRCDTRICVNPEHLLVGTHKDNSDDKMRRGRGGYENRRGVSQPRLRKLTTEQAREIAASSERQDVLALRHGVSIGTIRNVRHGAMYRDVLGDVKFVDRRFLANRDAPIVRPRSPHARRKLVESLVRRAG